MLFATGHSANFLQIVASTDTSVFVNLNQRLATVDPDCQPNYSG